MVRVGLKTDPGRDPEKQVNEDACAHRETPFGHLVVVCDGMGGHVGGREASTAAIEAIVHTFEVAPPTSAPADAPHGGRAMLDLAIAHANEVVYKLGVGFAESERPGSTVVAALVHDGGTEIAHVGDSRCYRIHDGVVVQLTKDHSMVQQLVDLGALTPDQAKHHPDANRITRALGTGVGERPELLPQPVAHVAGDSFVLCSDGLSDLVEPADILRIVIAAPPDQAAAQLVDLANARGGHDNITVAVVRTETSARPRAPVRPLARTLDDTAGAAAATALAVVAAGSSGRVVAAASSSGGLPPAPASSSALTPTMPEVMPSMPSELPPARAPRAPRSSIGLFIGLAFVAAGLAGGVYAFVLRERAEHPHRRPTPTRTYDMPTATPPTLGAPAAPAEAGMLEPLAASATPDTQEVIAPLHLGDAGRD